MFFFLSISILALYLPVAVSQLQCLQCNQKLNLTVSESINTTRPDCKLVNGSLCTLSLTIDYAKREADAYFGYSDDDAFILINGDTDLVHSMSIWLDKPKVQYMFNALCISNSSCTAALTTHSDNYNTMRSLDHEKLRANLVTYLYDSIADPADLICADNDDKPVPCPRGFCRLSSTDDSSFIRDCVREGSIPNPAGVLTGSSGMSLMTDTSSIMYACNRFMCNNSTMAMKARQVLKNGTQATITSII